jgi:RNA-directed DNA polymerase
MDEAVAAGGYEMVRYADVFVILCRTREEAERALARVRILTEQRGLTLHPVKTRIVDAAKPGEGFDFLGYHFEAGHCWPRAKSLKKLKETLRPLTKRAHGNSLPCIVNSVNRVLKGCMSTSSTATIRHSRSWMAGSAGACAVFCASAATAAKLARSPTIGAGSTHSFGTLGF